MGTSGGPDITGVFVYLMWVIEAAAFGIAAVLIAMDMAKEPFCDACDLWAKKSLSEVYIDSPGPSGVDVLKRATTIGALVDPPPPGPGAGGPLGKDRVLYSLAGCPSCGGSCTLTLKHVSVTRAGKREQSQTKVLHKHIALTTEEAALVRELIEPEEPGKSASEQKAAA